MQYVFYEEFDSSLKTLYHKGGPFTKAANSVLAMQTKARGGYSYNEVFSVAMTHNGESRIPHCKKYDLTGRARLVTVVNNNICMFLFAGDHDAVDKWLDKNKNIDFVAKRQGDVQVIEPVHVTSEVTREGIINTGNDLGAPDQLLQLISDRYQKKLLDGLSEELCLKIFETDSLVTDDELLETVEEIPDESQKSAVLDVLLKLREGDARGAKNRIGLFLGEVKKISELSEKETSEIQSGERVVKIEDVDPVLFEHFVKTADYQKWMLYLHPSQREFVNKDYASSVRLSGVSGSGKTCVLIHRALRLAEKYPHEKVLVITLNAALANLIESLIQVSRGELRPNNLFVCSFWQLCRDKLVEIEPHNNKLYTEQTIATNPYAVSEHIDDIWDEFYNCDHNNHDAELMFPLHRSLLVRNIFPKDYLKQELDYIRSAFAPWERRNYLQMERTGRSVPLDKPFRTQVLDGLSAWEKKMQFVGAIDATGIATSLYKHLDELKSEYRSILVDEVQDFGTLELAIIRKLVNEGENDLFLCGDAAQSVHTKFHDFDTAKINVRGGRSMRLLQNYRNSRQILSAAHNVLMRNFERRSKGFLELEILMPEYANFSSPKPLLLKAENLREEIEYAYSYAKSLVAEDSRKKICIAFAGYLQRGVEKIGLHLRLPTLSGDMDINSANIFLSELEQTKGFEFDTMIIVNAHSDILPHPDLPPEESFRDLCKFYVAMTRAKLELIVSYHGRVTDFIGDDPEHFVNGNWADGYADHISLGEWSIPGAGISEKHHGIEWNLTGRDFLRRPEAVGLAINAQDKLLELVTGTIRFIRQGRQQKQKTWGSIGEFLNDMLKPINRTPVSLSEEAWVAIASHFRRPTGPLNKVSVAEKMI